MVDLSLVLATAPLVLLVVAALALWIRRDGGPAFFGHQRIGRHGQSFACWKLRSMVPDSSARLAAHLAANPAARAEWERDFKLEHDPRITKLGAFLRRSSLDELPQLWNVIRGQMSLVGPRPVTEPELALYGDALAHYLSVRPGLTGLWQVSGRNDISYTERVALDVLYVERHSFVTDIRIIVKTAFAVFARTGK